MAKFMFQVTIYFTVKKGSFLGKSYSYYFYTEARKKLQLIHLHIKFQNCIAVSSWKAKWLFGQMFAVVAEVSEANARYLT